MESFERSFSWQKLLCMVLAIAAGNQVTEAQTKTGDVVVNMFGGADRMACFRPGGSPVWTSTGGSGAVWVGCAITPAGHTVTTRRTPVPGVDVFDRNGIQITSFDTPQMTWWPSDVAVFADGTLAVAELTGYVHHYTAAGAYLGLIYPLGFGQPLGLHVDANDDLFVCDDQWGGPGMLWKVSKTGALLWSVQLAFLPGDCVAADDGTLWLSDESGGAVEHLDANGAPIAGGFPTLVPGSFKGIGLASDGSFYLTGNTATQVFHYSGGGALLGSFPIIVPPAANPLYLAIAKVIPEPVKYCTAKVNSLGCLPSIAWNGQASATATSGFLVQCANVRNNKNGLLLYGITGRSSLPFQGGTLCTNTPVKRTKGVNSGGAPMPANDCSGLYSIDMNAFAHSGGPPVPLAELSVAGTLVNCQWWGRDPGFPAPDNTTLSDGLEYTVGQ